MKKTISLLLCLLCLFGSFAKATDIDIPWGTLFDDAQKLSQHVSWRAGSSVRASEIFKFLIDGDSEALYETIFCTYFQSPDIDICGHPVSKWNLYFAYIKNSEGSITKAKKNSIYVASEYTFEGLDEDQIKTWTKDIISSVKAEFGEPVNRIQRSSSILEPETSYIIWETEDTYIVLKTKGDSVLWSGEKCILSLRYGWKDADSSITEAYNTQKEEAWEDLEGL